MFDRSVIKPGLLPLNFSLTQHLCFSSSKIFPPTDDGIHTVISQLRKEVLWDILRGYLCVHGCIYTHKINPINCIQAFTEAPGEFL